MPARPTLTDWGMLLAMVAIGAVSFISIKVGLNSFGPYWLSAARLIIATLSLLLLRAERLSAVAAAGLAVGFAGCAVIILNRSSSGGSATSDLWPYLALGASTLALSLSIVIARRASQLTPVTKTLGALGFATVISVGFAVAVGEPLPREISIESWVAVFYMGIMPTGIAGLITYMLIERTSTRFVSLGNYLMPIGTLVLGAMVLAEAVGWVQLVGIAIILLGVAMSEWPRRKPRKTASD